MSQPSLSSILCKKGDISILVSELFNLCFSFVCHHPLYFSYLIFFFPNILKLVSYLSPLFITTFLLLLSFLISTLDQLGSESTNMGFLSTTYQVIFDTLRPCPLVPGHDFLENEEEEKKFLEHGFEELEAYKIVFETYTFETGEDDRDLGLLVDVPEVEVQVDQYNNFSRLKSRNMSDDEDDDQYPVENTLPCSDHGKIFQLLEEEEKDREDYELVKKELVVEKEVNRQGKEMDKVNQKVIKEKDLVTRESNAIASNKLNTIGVTDANYGKNEGDNYSTASSNISSSANSSPRSGSNYYSNSSVGGSMRREIEWRRTLACKLFEERHNKNIDKMSNNVDGNGGSEGMDMLWETHDEMESVTCSKRTGKSKSNKNHKEKERKKILMLDEEEDEEEDEELGSDGGRLCCLQALKFSAGKMNLGMGKPNLVKISKALKGFGWLHHVKHSKKANH